MSSLKSKTISGVFWSLFQNISSQGISIIISIVLARLLTPKDFGLVGMLSVFIGVSQAFINGGFDQALVQKKDADEKDFSSVFFINMTVSTLFYLLLFFGSPYIARFYNQPLLEPMTKVLGIGIIISAFSLVQSARLTKKMRFKTLMIIQIPSVITSGFVAIFMAWKGYGVWSIVAQQVVQRLVYSIQLWLYSKWTPQLIFDIERLRSMFKFGGNLMISSLFNRVYENLYPIIIGKIFSAQILGYYQNANTLINKPTHIIAVAVKNVTFPSLSQIQDDNEKLKTAYKKTIIQVLFWITPIITIMAFLAEPLFRFVLTDKWLPAVPYFQIIAIASVLTPITVFNLDIVKVKGQGALFLRINILRKIITTIGVVLAIPLGIWALIIFVPINTLISYLINAYYSGRLINYSIKEQLKDVFPILLLGLITGLSVFILDRYIFIQLNDFFRLALGSIIGFSFFFVNAVFFKFESLKDFKEIAGFILRRKK